MTEKSWAEHEVKIVLDNLKRLFFEDENGCMHEVKLEDADKELLDKLMDYIKKCENNNG